MACPLAIYVSINPFGTAAAAIPDVILFTGLGQDRTLSNEAGYYTLDQGPHSFRWLKLFVFTEQLSLDICLSSDLSGQ
jgi:hypothetical protein